MNSRTKTGVDLTTDKMALQRIKEAAEKAKKELSISNYRQTSTSHYITANS